MTASCNVSLVTNMSYLLNVEDSFYAENSYDTFNSSISNWDVSSVTTME